MSAEATVTATAYRVTRKGTESPVAWICLGCSGRSIDPETMDAERVEILAANVRCSVCNQPLPRDGTT